MFSIILLLQVVAIRLRLSGNGGPFKRPLSAEEERDAVGRMRAGDEAARDMLIEHNYFVAPQDLHPCYKTPKRHLAPPLSYQSRNRHAELRP
ncbi:hypothetical protein FACS1894202_08920 [Clostridia bacterium]|nr:hypothetical protein FACS1894202_08920 [Clostridia bacterium]